MGKKRARDDDEEEEPRRPQKEHKKTRVANFSELSLDSLLEREVELANEVRERQQELSDARRLKPLLYGNSEARQMNTRRLRAEYAHAEVQAEIQRRFKAMEEEKQKQQQVAAKKKADAALKEANERPSEYPWMLQGAASASSNAMAAQVAAIAAATAGMPGASQFAPGGLAASLAGLQGLSPQALSSLGLGAGAALGGLGAGGMPGAGMAQGLTGMTAGLTPFMPGPVPAGAINLGGLPAGAQLPGMFGQPNPAVAAAGLGNFGGVGGLPAGLRGLNPMQGNLGVGVPGAMNSTGMPLAFMRR